MADKIRLAVMAEHAPLSGRRAWRREEEDDWDSDDILVFEGSGRDLMAESFAYHHLAEMVQAATQGFSRKERFYRFVSRAISGVVDVSDLCDDDDCAECGACGGPDCATAI